MKSNKIILTVVLLLIASFSYSQSKLVDDQFFSTSLDTIRDLRVYLPDEYDSLDVTKNYSVIYFLHGSGGDHTSYSGIYPILDSLITNNIIKPVIVVVPDGSSGPFLGSNYSNSTLYGLFEDYIAFDVIDYIDSKYKTIPSKDNRAIMGHSMGGEGSMRIALKHPELYSGVASHSGVLSDGFIDFLGPLVLAEMDSTNIIKPTNGYMSQALFTAAGGKTPNMNNPPYYVDLPIDNNGNLIDGTWAKWLQSDPVYFATKYNPESNLHIYFDCGTDDFMSLFYYTTIFADTLKSLNIPFEFQSFKGGHSDKFYERFKISVIFLNSVINKNSERIKEVKSNMIESNLVKYTRIYSDANGESHFEDLEIELAQVDFAPPAPPLFLSPLIEATKFGYLSSPLDWVGDWHPTPKRQVFFYLSGQIKAKVSDGEVRLFGPGSITLVEDTSGKGHTSRAIGKERILLAFVQLED
ncbi:alpha/beta hydrolase-fold protein [Candidatus Neomarinimicrobiota bacterium]